MPSEHYEWDFFITHAGADKRPAEKLYDYLKPKSRVFLDCRSLVLGDDWDTELRRAQKTSLVTVVLISEKTEAAYYQREEIAAAIALARANAAQHRVVPVFLDRHAHSNDSLPYGLRLKHGLVLSDKLSLKAVGTQLLDLLSHLAQAAGDGRDLVSETTDPSNEETASGRVQSGLPEELIDFEDQRHLFERMLADSPEKRLMFIKAAGGRGKSSLLRMFGFHCEQQGIPYCRIDSGEQPYDQPHFTLAVAICDQLGLSPRHLAQALQYLSAYKPEGEIDDPYVASQILAAVSVTHDSLRQRHVRERLKSAFLADLSQFAAQKGRIVCLFDGFERLSAEEEDWLLETLLKSVVTGKLQRVIIVTAGHRWPTINKWEWEHNAHLLDDLPKMNAGHIKIYAERINISITDDEATHYWKASGGGIPLYMAMVVHNLRALKETGS
jgi:hypothetical protein